MQYFQCARQAGQYTSSVYGQKETRFFFNYHQNKDMSFKPTITITNLTDNLKKVVVHKWCEAIHV